MILSSRKQCANKLYPDNPVYPVKFTVVKGNAHFTGACPVAPGDGTGVVPEDRTGVNPACPVAPADGTGVAPANGTGVAPADGTGV